MFRAYRVHHQGRQIVSANQRMYWYNFSLLIMSTMCSKHVESY